MCSKINQKLPKSIKKNQKNTKKNQKEPNSAKSYKLYQTLPEAQRTQGIKSAAWIIFLTKINLKRFYLKYYLSYELNTMGPLFLWLFLWDSKSVSRNMDLRDARASKNHQFFRPLLLQMVQRRDDGPEFPLLCLGISKKVRRTVTNMPTGRNY